MIKLFKKNEVVIKTLIIVYLKQLKFITMSLESVTGEKASNLSSSISTHFRKTSKEVFYSSGKFWQSFSGTKIIVCF